MPLPAFVPSVADDIRDAIDAELRGIEDDHDVRIIFAVESGSRAWGFPSPDSDYDVRFVYAHRTDWYLSIRPGRDVIERPISDELDISGWDIRKALGLLIKPNPVLLEWLSSPIRYTWDEALCDALIGFSQKPAHAVSCLYHYLNLGRGQYESHIQGGGELKLKKYFYALRPALTIRWIRLNEDVIPPMNLQALASELDLAPDVLEAIADLIDRKSRMLEGEGADRIASLDALMEAEFEWAAKTAMKTEKQRLVGEADRLFRHVLRVCDDR